MSAQGYTGAPSGGGSGPFPISSITGLQAALTALQNADADLAAADAAAALVNATASEVAAAILALQTSLTSAYQAADATVQYTANLAYDLSLQLSAALTRPVDYGFQGWTFDPVLVQGGSVIAPAGTSFVARIRATGFLATNIHFHTTAGGSALTSGQCYVTLHNDAGVLLGAGAVSGDLSGSGAGGFGGGGYKTIPLVTPQALTPGNWYRVRYWFNGTTGPTFSRALSSSTAILNASGPSSTVLRYATADTGLTTLALAPTTIGTQTGGAVAHWVAIS